MARRRDRRFGSHTWSAIHQPGRSSRSGKFRIGSPRGLATRWNGRCESAADATQRDAGGIFDRWIDRTAWPTADGESDGGGENPSSNIVNLAWAGPSSSIRKQPNQHSVASIG